MQVFREDFLQQKIPTNFLVLAQKAPILCSIKYGFCHLAKQRIIHKLHVNV